VPLVEEKKNAHRILVEKPETRILLGSCRQMGE